MEQDKHTYRARLDFLYQSIAMYAATIVIYLLIRSTILTKTFPTLWEDPLLLLLSAITLISVIGLGYNLYLKRELILLSDRIDFRSRARERAIEKKDVTSVKFGRVLSKRRTTVRTVKITVRDRRRPIRIHLLNFEHSKRLLHDLKEWAGPLTHDAGAHTGRRIRRAGRSTAEGEGRTPQ